jgi:hypothetical protein
MEDYFVDGNLDGIYGEIQGTDQSDDCLGRPSLMMLGSRGLNEGPNPVDF